MPRRCSSEPANGTADPSADSLAPGGVRTPQDLTVNRCQRHACLASGAVSRVQNFAGECPTNAEDVDVQALGRIKLGDPLVLGDRLRRVLPAAHYGWIARASVPAVRHLRNSTRHASGASLDCAVRGMRAFPFSTRELRPSPSVEDPGVHAMKRRRYCRASRSRRFCARCGHSRHGIRGMLLGYYFGPWRTSVTASATLPRPSPRGRRRPR